MSKPLISARSLIAGLALIAIVVAAFSLGVSAQDPNGSVPDVSLQADVEANPPDSGERGQVTEKVTVVEEVELVSGPQGPNVASFYKRYPAHVFVPYDDDMIYLYLNGGCVSRTSGTNYTGHTLQLPDGAVVDYLRVYFYDNDASNDAWASLYSFDGAGGYTLIAEVHSSGTPGWSEALSPIFAHTVDNTTESLALRFNYDGASTTDLRICAVRVRYQYTLAKTSLPEMLNDANP